jgi:multimeric flavodoxin WrbA
MVNKKPSVLGLGFSPRKGGNSDQILKWALEGARKAGSETKSLHVRDYRVKPCTNCSECEEDGICTLKDDFSKLRKEIDNADFLIIASPIYFLGVPAHAKAMIDRFQSYWVRKHLLNRLHPRGDRPALLLCVAGSEKKDVFDCAKRTVMAFLNVAGFKLADKEFFEGIDRKGSVKYQPEPKRLSERAGENLVLTKD